ncbi:MAG: DivIVA domain-containing protein [Ignavibacteriae bacterium]|nr:DivIVA domain-containing protein [Ignavibacteriota bacterium]
MRLTPLDIRKQEFKKVIRGYDHVEVDTFMEMMANEFEELLKMQREMRDKVLELETQLKDYKQIERTLQQTLLQAQETTGKTYENARREAEMILKEAEMKAAKIVEQANSDLVKKKSELSQVHARKESLVGRLRVMLSSELDLIKALEMGADPVLNNNPSLGTGKEGIELESILKNIDNDSNSKAH